MLDDPDPRCRSAVVDGIRSWNTDEALLHKALSDKSHRVVCSALVNLWHINREHSRHMLECLLGHEDYRFRAAATWALGACGCTTLRSLAERMKQDEHPSVRWNALRALSAIHRAAAQS
jgi:HEAT repeat protein